MTEMRLRIDSEEEEVTLDYSAVEMWSFRRCRQGRSMTGWSKRR
jgi:hypothetical protein